MGPALVRWYDEKLITDKDNNDMLHQKEGYWESTSDARLASLTEATAPLGIDVKVTINTWSSY